MAKPYAECTNGAGAPVLSGCVTTDRAFWTLSLILAEISRVERGGRKSEIGDDEGDGGKNDEQPRCKKPRWEGGGPG